MDPEEIARGIEPDRVDPNDTKYPVLDGMPEDEAISVNSLAQQGFVEKPVRCFTDNAGIYYFLIDGEWMPLRTD